MWIMISPLAIASLAMQSVVGGDPARREVDPAVAEVATFGPHGAKTDACSRSCAGPVASRWAPSWRPDGDMAVGSERLVLQG
jgi:hypothetical protein